MNRLSLLAALLVMTPALAAPPDAVGHWEGAIETPSSKLAIALDFSHDKESWAGRIDVPVQGIRGLGVIDLKIEGASVAFGLPQVPGEPRFAGQLAADGQSIAGTFTQAGKSLPFRVERAQAQPGSDPATLYKEFELPGAPGEGIVGDWRGMLVGGPHKLRLVLHVSKAADGSMTATLDSLDQGANNLSVDAIRLEGTAVRFEMRPLSAVFTGTLSADGAQIEGSWQQGEGGAPLTFRRKAG